MATYAMVIDLGKCVGCSACQIACKIENTVGEGVFYSRHETVMAGSFPDVTYKYIPTMCNHCADAACVAACPVGAMAKVDGLTMHDDATCIGCGACVAACPYNMVSLRAPDGFAAFDSEKEIIKGCTSSGSEVAKAVGAAVPYGRFAAAGEDVVMSASVSQKCNFCKHLVDAGEDPYCVHMCPAGARLWGDVEDAESDVAAVLAENSASVSHPEYGTNPHVYYVGTFGR